MRYIASEGIFEAAWMSCAGKGDAADLYDNMDTWIDEFRAEVNKRLPEGVEICVHHCSQLGDAAQFVDEDTFEGILTEAEQAVDDRIDEVLGLEDAETETETEPESEKLWYAVMMDLDDTDWGIGSFDKAEAAEILARYRENYPEAYIAVVSGAGTDNAKCVDVIDKDTAVWARLSRQLATEGGAEA